MEQIKRHTYRIIIAGLVTASAAASSTGFAQTDGPWLDEQQTEGTWIYSRDAGESHAMFGSVAKIDKFVITCSRASRQLRLSRPGEVAQGARMRVRTETMQRELEVAPLVGMRNINVVFAGLHANDRLLDAMAITKGRFAIETDGLPTLYLPAWAEISRVIEDCR